MTTLLDQHSIARLAMLARLRVDEESATQACAQLNAFFSVVEKMQSINTEGVEPLHHPVSIMGDITLRLDDDVVRESNQRERNQQSAPAVEAGLFLVPRVIE